MVQVEGSGSGFVELEGGFYSGRGLLFCFFRLKTPHISQPRYLPLSGVSLVGQYSHHYQKLLHNGSFLFQHGRKHFSKTGQM